jgi:VHL beta domain
MRVFKRSAIAILIATSCLFGGVVVGESRAQAAACEEAHDPSPASDQPTGIVFHNETSYATQIYWIDFDGFLKEYGLVQPGESVSYNTYIGHQWLVELYASEDRTECFGPIVPRESESCQARILWDNGIGIDAGYCDF